jgi:uncharacterized ion transporter superfamily protein YfcC
MQTHNRNLVAKHKSALRVFTANVLSLILAIITRGWLNSMRFQACIFALLCDKTKKHKMVLNTVTIIHNTEDYREEEEEECRLNSGLVSMRAE